MANVQVDSGLLVISCITGWANGLAHGYIPDRRRNANTRRSSIRSNDLIVNMTIVLFLVLITEFLMFLSRFSTKEQVLELVVLSLIHSEMMK